MQPSPSVFDRWSGVAPFWEKHRILIRQMFAPVTEALIEDAGIGSGHAVLDIATGPGEPALTVAAVVGPEGKVMGVDPVPGMVAAARRAAENEGLRNAQFELASAHRLPFPAAGFDAVVSRFGVMFFPSPVDAVREMLRVLRPGRKLALAVWGQPDKNPVFDTLSRIIDRYVESPPLEPDAPDAYRFAASGKLLGVVREAGAEAPVERLLPFTIQAPVAAEDFWALRSEMSEKFREKLAALSPEQLPEVRRLGLQAIREYATGDGLSFPAEVLMVSGIRSV